MRSLIPLLLVLACPLMMIFMMRGMHGGHGDNEQQTHMHERHNGTGHEAARGERIAELEREVAALRGRAGDRDDAEAGRR